MDDDELLQLVVWLADDGACRQAPSRPAGSAQDDRLVRGVLGRLADDSQEQYVAPARRARMESK
jgi:hypothetical protein